ncbi:hypothetical protein [Streptomyces sp. NPDC014764]|uniref:hypothetical protein n=1 Tax=Streptomyces sp. NPDC014764 TaxID=3364907 RepID=UPI0036FCB85A
MASCARDADPLVAASGAVTVVGTPLRWWVLRTHPAGLCVCAGHHMVPAGSGVLTPPQSIRDRLGLTEAEPQMNLKPGIGGYLSGQTDSLSEGRSCTLSNAVPLAGLLGAIIGAAVTWLSPVRTGKISRAENDRLEAKKREKDTEERAEQREVLRKSALFDRMVVLRNETRLHLLELHRLYFIADSNRLTLPRSQFGAIHWYQGSTCHDIARSIGKSYPRVLDAWHAYSEELHEAVDELGNFTAANPFTRSRNFLQLVERLTADLDAKREVLKTELSNAAWDLGYEFVLAEEWN